MIKHYKKNLLLAFILMFAALTAIGCVQSDQAISQETEQTELIVFAAASMTESLQAVGNQYMSENPNVSIIFNFDSSGTLKTQIEEGADCDVYISASQKQMNQLDIDKDETSNPDQLDFVLAGTRRNILENKVTLCVPSENPASVTSFDNFADKLSDNALFFAMGNADVPVGQYAQKILVYYNLDEEAIANNGCITYGSNVKEVVTQIQENAVDCGIVYCTDAFSDNLTIIDEATTEMCGQVVYPAAIINTTNKEESAQAFLEYLSSDAAAPIFEAVGFTVIK